MLNFAYRSDFLSFLKVALLISHGTCDTLEFSKLFTYPVNNNIRFFRKNRFLLEMSIDEIMNGSPEKMFPGLLPLVQDYLRNIEVDTDTMCTLSRYWIYLQRKAQCQIMTNAGFIRNFVQKVHTEILS